MIQRLLFVTLIGMLCSTVNGQSLRKVAELSSRVEETSGLLNLDGRLITHNDSGGSQRLFEVNPTTGSVTRDVYIDGVSSTDWEDICADDEHIYIGDIGNNDGSRTNLEIYKIPIADYLDGDGNAEAEQIRFAYGDQTSFVPNLYQTNFDAETLVAYGEHLLIFTKNWEDGNTRIYKVAKNTTAAQSLQPIATLTVGGLVTSGVYDDERKVILLTGYSSFIPFILELQVDGSLEFESFPSTFQLLDTQGGSTQIEGIALANDSTYFLSGERTASSNPTLYIYDVNGVSRTSSLPIQASHVFPNPAKNTLQVEGENLVMLVLIDLTGRRIRVSSTSIMEVADLPRGAYHLEAYSSTGNRTVTKVVLQ